MPNEDVAALAGALASESALRYSGSRWHACPVAPHRNLSPYRPPSLPLRSPPQHAAPMTCPKRWTTAPVRLAVAAPSVPCLASAVRPPVPARSAAVPKAPDPRHQMSVDAPIAAPLVPLSVNGRRLAVPSMTPRCPQDWPRRSADTAPSAAHHTQPARSSYPTGPLIISNRPAHDTALARPPYPHGSPTCPLRSARRLENALSPSRVGRRHRLRGPPIRPDGPVTVPPPLPDKS